MFHKLKFAALPLSLALILGACSDAEEPAAEPEQTEEPAADAEAQEAQEAALVEEDEVVAVVNGEEIPGKVYNSVAGQMQASLQAQGQDVTAPEVQEQLKTQVADIIVGNALIIQDAREKGHEPDEAAVDEQLGQMTEQFGGEEAMEEALASTGFTSDDLRNQLREQLMYESYVAKEIQVEEVTDAEVQEAYDQYAGSMEDAPALEEIEANLRTSLEQDRISQALLVRIDELKADADIDVRV